MVVAGKKALELASDAEETENRFRAVWGPMADDAAKFAKELGESVGRSKTEIKDGLASFMGFTKGMGIADDQAGEMAKKLQALSIDFASFNNMSDGEAQQRFISAMSGSSEVLDMFGINVKDSALNLELQNSGLAESSAKATEAQKAMARYNIIVKTMGKQGAVGDAAATADSYANTLKRLQSEVREAGELLGQLLIPAAAKVVTGFISAAKAVKSFFEFLKPKDIDDTIEKLKEMGASVEDISKLQLTSELNKATDEYRKLSEAVSSSKWDEAKAQEAVKKSLGENVDSTIKIGKIQNQLAASAAEYEKFQQKINDNLNMGYGAVRGFSDAEKERFNTLSAQRRELEAQLKQNRSISKSASISFVEKAQWVWSL